MALKIKNNPFFRNYIGITGAIIVLCILLSIASPYFLNVSNFINIGNQIALNLIIAVGMTIVITTGGIDLSVGANVALTGIVVANFYYAAGGGPFALITGLLLGLVVGVGIGVFNGVLVTYINVPPFITTLGGMVAFRGLALVLSNGRVLYGLPESFQAVFGGFLFGTIPKSVIVAAVISAVGIFILNKTNLGRYTKALGGNENCLRVCGININRIKMTVYMISGATAAISSLALTSMMNAAEPNAGNFYELDAIAIVVMGGTSLMGGKGSVVGTILGALLLGVVRNGLNLMKVPPNFHQLILGVIILGAVILGSKRSDT